MSLQDGRTNIFSIFNRADFEKMVEDGWVNIRRHPTLPLNIANYTPETQYRNYWNDVTEWCRGLIFDDDYNIVARSWKKFYNLGQVNLPIQLTDPVEVMDKADGSLGILYPMVVDTPEVFDIVYGIATRGSFESEQAKHATRIWQEKYHNLDPLPGYTMLFEVVFPENRIVLNYDGMDDLILLGAVQNDTGYYVGPNVAKGLFTERGHAQKTFVEWPGPVVKVFDFNTISEALGNMERENAEGYVIRSHNFMVKLKQPDYLNLHRLVTNMTPKVIWEKLRDGLSVAEICADLPDEFHSMAEDFAEPLVGRYEERLDEIFSEFSRVSREYNKTVSGDEDFNRGKYARFIRNHPDKRYFFLMLDDRSIHDVLWAELKPRETISPQED